MVDAIQAVGIEPAAQGAGAPGGGQPVADAYEVNQFAEAMNRAGGSPSAANVTPDVASVGASEPSQGMRMLMSAVDNLNGGAESINSLAKTMTQNTGELTPGQVIEMTMKSHHFLFQCEMTSNVANRTSDGIQQLFRQQS
ncbi:hypothetical protein [Luteimonas sp. TWI1437]|uniref:hypothetical protein n=1 Tax=unclassified Luteimonas TaxID=2629088 RepID=UPI00320B1A7D